MSNRGAPSEPPTMAPDQNHQNGVSILDIRRNELQISMIDELHSGLRPPHGGEKRMPTMLLYDEKGLKLFEDITYLEEYYLTNAEIEVLERYADHIAERIHNGSQVVELGSGYALASWATSSPSLKLKIRLGCLSMNH